MKPVTEHPPAPIHERRQWRQSASYKLALFIVLVLLLGGILYFLKTPRPETGVAGTRGALPARPPAVLPPERMSSSAGAQPDAGGPGGQTAGTQAASAPGASPGAAADAVALLRERLQALTGTPGTEADGTTVGGARSASSPDELRSQTDARAGTKPGADGGAKYGVDLPPYDRKAFAERQRELEALRAQTMADLKKVSPNDPEGMLRVIERMSQNLQAQGLPNIVDMPKMEAMLRGSRRLNELNTALVTEMGRAGGGRPEEMARLANEIRAVQATIPSTVYDLDAVGRLMRGELP